MPIHETDPWREQYFAPVPCPEGLLIPTDDETAYQLNPDHRWLYNKLLVARSQGLECGACARAPSNYPVFSKPIVNLEGMGIGSRVLRNVEEYERHCNNGNFWTELLEGPHISTDWALIRGEPHWCRHAHGIPGPGGTFDHWIIETEERPELERYSCEWIAQFLPDYTGMVNIETIGGRIIEVHLRLTDQWPDLYGAGWVDAVIDLYQNHRWHFADADRAEGYSVVLFGPHGVRYRHPAPERLQEYRARPEVKSVQITFSERLPPSAHAMPPGGFRLAVVNCSCLVTGMQLRSELEREFGLQESEQLDRLAG